MARRPAADAFLLGRTTYEIMAVYWPQVIDEDEVARKLNDLPKYVVSKDARQDHVEQLNPDQRRPCERDHKAYNKGEAGQELQVQGSGKLAQTLIRHDLIDEYRLCFRPVALGSGKRLFPEGQPPIALKLIETKTTGTGIVIHV